MDLIWALNTIEYIPVLKYQTARDMLSLSMVNRHIHKSLDSRPLHFWRQLACQAGAAGRRSRLDRCVVGLRDYLSSTQALYLRFMRHPHRNFVAHPRAAFGDLSGPALSCIHRRNGNVLFLIRSGTGFVRMRPIEDRRRWIGEEVVAGDLIQVLPTNTAFLVYDRGAFRGSDLVGEIGDDFVPLDEEEEEEEVGSGPDRMATFFPMIIRYLHSGRPWSILFNDPDGPPSRPVQMICSRRSDKRRCLAIRPSPRENMTSTFDELETYLRLKAGHKAAHPNSSLPALYPLLRQAMDPAQLTDFNYVYIWWSADRYWFQLNLHPVNRPWLFPIISFQTLDALFSELEQLQLVRDSTFGVIKSA